MNGIYLLFGSNLGDRLIQFADAVRLLQEHGIEIKRFSTIYETEPWGILDQPKFLNMVVEVETELLANQLLEKCLLVERQLGRKREVKWGARTIDIDILFYRDCIISSDSLKVPHPGIQDRLFTLIPLCELAGDEMHPELQLPLKRLLNNMTNDHSCKRTELHLAL